MKTGLKSIAAAAIAAFTFGFAPSVMADTTGNGYSTVVSMDGWSTTTSHTLSGGTVYTLSSSKTFTPSTAGSSALVVNGSSSNPAVIYIPQGVTLTVNGKSGSGATSGGAGISVASSYGLIVCGEGQLVATGGNAGTAGNGSQGGNADASGSDTWYTGTGGTGGVGGGGAGAGIGGAGGAGGSGGSGGARQKLTGKGDTGNGNAGGQGGSGSSGATMGTVWLYGPLTVTASCGSTGSQGSGAGQGKDVDDKQWSSRYYGLGGGGGGGGGGAGSAASYGIGGGGAGGGAGGGGGGGGSDWGNSFHTWNPQGPTGGAGYGGKSLSGSAGSQGSPSSPQDSGDGKKGGACGAAGSAGSDGGVGTFYVSSLTTSVTGRGSASTQSSDSHAAITYTVSLNDGLSIVRTTQAVLSMPVANVTPPTRTGSVFLGYYTEMDGKGTLMFDKDGKAQQNLWTTIGDTTLYAYWNHSATIETPVHGTVTPDPQTAHRAMVVTLTVAPDTDYIYERGSLTVTGRTSGSTMTITRVSDNTFTFEMPDESVTVTALFATKEETLELKDASGSPTEVKMNRVWVEDLTGTISEAAQQEMLNVMQANNLRRWQNEILGLTGSDPTSKPVIAPIQTSDPGSIAFRLSGVNVATASGATVTYRVWWGAAPGEEEEGPSDEVAYDQTVAVAVPSSGVQYYNIEVLIK